MNSLSDLVRARRMCRAFRPDPLPTGSLDRLVDLAARAPSAGKTQGWHLVVLEGADTARYWDITLPDERRDTFAWPHLLDAPVIAVALADPHAYLDRYSEPDKIHTGLGGSVDVWPAPYWTIDAAMAVMTLLLAAEDEGLGALFFGIFQGEGELRRRLGIPGGLELLGTIALGYPRGGDERPGVSRDRRRRHPAEILHRGGW